AQGHSVAYTIMQSDGSVKLVVITPGESKQHVFDLPYSTSQTVSWSPDGKWVMVGSYEPDVSARSAQIYLYGIDGTIRTNIGKAVEANLGIADVPVFTEIGWSASGNSLLYSEFNATI